MNEDYSKLVTMEEIVPNLKTKKCYKVGRTINEILAECRQQRDNPPPVNTTKILKMPHVIFQY